MADEADVTLNGVDLETLTQLAAEVDTDPERAADLGETDASARVQWRAGFNSQGYSGDAPPHAYDEPEWLGGTDAGMPAREALLGAVGACVVTGFAANASLRDVTIHELEVEVEGHVDIPSFLGLGDGDSGFEELEITINVDCDAEGKLLEEIALRAVDLSPVVNTVQKPVDVDYEVEEMA